jgi:hypothetical protein
MMGPLPMINTERMDVSFGMIGGKIWIARKDSQSLFAKHYFYGSS